MARAIRLLLLILADHKPLDTKHCVAALTLASGDTLRVVTSYTHLGTIVATTDCSAQDLAHRRATTQAEEKAQAMHIPSASHVPYKCKMRVVTASHASLMYASATWWPL